MTGDVSGDLTGKRLGHYRIEGVLGRGGMSVMYRATDVRLGRKVALKVIGEHLGADAEFRERFVDEARNTSAIDHANIVPLYDFGELDGLLYIAMRLVDGSDLASLIGGEPMRPERAIGLLDQVADALDTLHARGLVHLDVKPANVLVTSRESAREHVYVADFGLTRRGATGHRTRGGDFLGSPTYAAPEHLRGEPLDGRTDQYALACMLYACLTGHPPFHGEVSAVIKGHLSGEPEPVSRAVGTLPRGLDDVVRKGMAKSPQDRYGGCVELIAAARKALLPEPVAPAALSGTPATGGRRPVAVGNGEEGSPAGQRPFGGQAGQQPAPQAHRQPQAQPPPGHHPGRYPSGYGPAPGHPSGYGPPPPGFAGPPPGTPPHGAPGFGPRPHQAPPPGGGFPNPAQPPPRGGGKGWVLWVVLAVVLVGVGVAVVVALSGSGDESRPPAPQTSSRAPDIPVGPDDGAGTPTGSGDRPPPTSIPIVPGTGG
ncbi:serine/threonine-protein kinase [Prauserella shujinwangii]|uniref:non-specific serine/threonine protein kinase n=1 Tax=Prauserella shujinwangii TaxID=1453103 RepID=A0A2T0M128_9PSEU|nr:serine/threonine-protein kinase [Prauserella shujinwangii]PRX50288.1 serine/threonine-protein kinase [Prauserella shujinwangii]